MTVLDVLKKITLPAYEYSADPIKLKEDSYWNERDRLVRETTRFAGVHSIYMANYHLYPGITKLDLIYVLNDQHDTKVIEKGLIATTSKVAATSSLLQFPRLYPETIFRDIYQLSPPLTLQRLHGAELRFNLLPQEERSFTYCSFLNDRLLVSPISTFIPALVDGKFAVRDTLCALELTRDLLLYFAIAAQKKMTRWDSFQTDLAELLQKWFELGLERYQRMKEMVRTAVSVLFDLIETFCQYLIKEKLVFSQEKDFSISASEIRPRAYPDKQAGSRDEASLASSIRKDKDEAKSEIRYAESGYAASFFTRNVQAIFIDSWQSGAALQKMIDIYRKTNSFYSYLPKELAVQLEQYAHGIDSHTKQVQKALVVKEWLGGLAFPNVVNARNRLISKQMTFLEQYQSLPPQPDLFDYPVEKPQRWDKLAPFLSEKFAAKREQERKLQQEKMVSMVLNG